MRTFPWKSYSLQLIQSSLGTIVEWEMMNIMVNSISQRMTVQLLVLSIKCLVEVCEEVDLSVGDPYFIS